MNVKLTVANSASKALRIFKASDFYRLTQLVSFWWGAVVVVAILVGGLSWSLYSSRGTIIPSTIASQISYVVFWPRLNAAKPSVSSIKYSATDNVFSYTMSVTGTQVTMTEEATPSEFADIPNYYSALVNHLNNYYTFDSANGTVYLTQPNKAPGEVAVDNQSGTLMFAHTQGTISVNSWRKLFNNLKTIEN